MRKLVSIMVAVMAVLALAACDFKEKKGNDLEWLMASYSKVAEATSISETTEISSGKLVRYSCEKKYVLNGEKYEVTTTEKTLNKLSEDETYATKTSTDTVDRASDYVAKAELSESNFDEYDLSETGLKGKIKDGKLATVLGIDELTATDATLDISVKNDKVTSIQISYLTSNDTVTISILFEY